MTLNELAIDHFLGLTPEGRKTELNKINKGARGHMLLALADNLDSCNATADECDKETSSLKQIITDQREAMHHLTKANDQHQSVSVEQQREIDELREEALQTDEMVNALIAALNAVVSKNVALMDLVNGERASALWLGQTARPRC